MRDKSLRLPLVRCHFAGRGRVHQDAIVHKTRPSKYVPRSDHKIFFFLLESHEDIYFRRGKEENLLLFSSSRLRFWAPVEVIDFVAFRIFFSMVHTNPSTSDREMYLDSWNSYADELETDGRTEKILIYLIFVILKNTFQYCTHQSKLNVKMYFGNFLFNCDSCPSTCIALPIYGPQNMTSHTGMLSH